MRPYELMAPGHANVWVCELGSKAQNGSFTAFTDAFAEDALCGDTFDFSYQSPSQGEMCFGWTRPLTVCGKAVALHDYPRYDNPFCHALFGAQRFDICTGDTHSVICYVQPEAPEK